MQLRSYPVLEAEIWNPLQSVVWSVINLGNDHINPLVLQVVKKNEAGLTLVGQQSIQGLGPLLQLFSTYAPLLIVAHLTPLTHEEQTRPPLCCTVDQDHIRTEKKDVNKYA